MNFEICVQQYAFTKRCWWQLSSLAQQKLCSNVTYKLNLYKDDPFHKLNLQLIDTFRNLVNMKVKIWDDWHFMHRGETRNADLVEATSEWVIFMDADVAFHPSFFNVINNANLKTDKMNVIRRFSTTIEDGYKLIDSQTYDDKPIADAVGKLTGLPLKQSCNIGAGYFQLVNVDYIKSQKLEYSKWRDRSIKSRRGPSYKSDRYLRSKIGTFRTSIAPLYHINHYRLKDTDHADLRSTCQ